MKVKLRESHATAPVRAELCEVAGKQLVCVHLPGGLLVMVEAANSELSDDARLDLGLKAVDQNLERLLKAAPPTVRRAYCLALGGGFES